MQRGNISVTLPVKFRSSEYIPRQIYLTAAKILNLDISVFQAGKKPAEYQPPFASVFPGNTFNRSAAKFEDKKTITVLP